MANCHLSYPFPLWLCDAKMILLWSVLTQFSYTTHLHLSHDVRNRRKGFSSSEFTFSPFFYKWKCNKQFLSRFMIYFLLYLIIPIIMWTQIWCLNSGDTNRALLMYALCVLCVCAWSLIGLYWGGLATLNNMKSASLYSMSLCQRIPHHPCPSPHWKWFFIFVSFQRWLQVY